MSTIMIVEDDPKINQLLQEQLEKYGFQTVNVEHFDRVMEVFTQSRPDLVLLDVNLPKFDGFYWCRQMRQESNCPILFISARESKMDQVMALENGADDYITKPFDYDVVCKSAVSYAGLTDSMLRKKGNVRLKWRGSSCFWSEWSYLCTIPKSS